MYGVFLMFGFIKRNKYYFLIIFTVLITALFIRMNCRNTFVFYAYHSQTSIFPRITVYSIVYFIRIIISAVLLYITFKIKNRIKNYKEMIVWSAYFIVAVLIEYKLIFYLESIFTVIVLRSVTIIGLVKSLILFYKYKGSVLCILTFILIDIYLIICLFSMIV